MKFTCEKAALYAAVSTAQRAVSAKSSIPALEGLLIEAGEALTVSGYNMSTGIRSTVEADIIEQGSLVLNSRLFGDIVRRLPEDTLCFDCDSKLLVTIHCGDAHFEIPGMNANDFPELPEVEENYSFAITQTVLRSMLNETGFAVSTNEARPVHTGSLFEIDDSGLTVVSVDGFRLALRREPLDQIEGGDFRFVAPGSALNEVEKICGETDDFAFVTALPWPAWRRTPTSGAC